jgi:hypothetical protein
MICAAVPPVLFWIVLLLYLLFNESVADWRTIGTLVCLVIGLGLTLTALVFGWRIVLIAAGFANAGLVYGIATRALSQYSYGVWAGAAVGMSSTVVLGFGLWRLFPYAWRELWAWVFGPLDRGTPEEKEHFIWWAIALLPPVLFLGVDQFSKLASPAPLILAVLSGLAALYGLCNYLFPRSSAVLSGLVVVFALLSHLQPYKMRFDDLNDPKALNWYTPEDALKLDEVAAEEKKRQLAFEVALSKFQGETDPDVVAAAAADLSRIWAEMEQNHRVKAGQLITERRKLLEGGKSQGVNFPVGVGQVQPSKAGLLDPAKLGVAPSVKSTDANAQKPPLVAIAVSGGGQPLDNGPGIGTERRQAMDQIAP